MRKLPQKQKPLKHRGTEEAEEIREKGKPLPRITPMSADQERIGKEQGLPLINSDDTDEETATTTKIFETQRNRGSRGNWGKGKTFTADNADERGSGENRERARLTTD
jgi:hypothetical protein